MKLQSMVAHDGYRQPVKSTPNPSIRYKLNEIKMTRIEISFFDDILQIFKEDSGKCNGVQDYLGIEHIEYSIESC